MAMIRGRVIAEKPQREYHHAAQEIHGAVARAQAQKQSPEVVSPRVTAFQLAAEFSCFESTAADLF